MEWSAAAKKGARIESSLTGLPGRLYLLVCATAHAQELPPDLTELLRHQTHQLLRLIHISINKTIDYIEIPTRDISASKAFFKSLFAWSFEDHGAQYSSFDDGRMTGGFRADKKASAIAAGSVLVVSSRVVADSILLNQVGESLRFGQKSNSLSQ